MGHELFVSVAVHEDVSRVALDQLFRGGAAKLVPVADVDGYTIDSERNLFGKVRVIGRIRISENRSHRGDQGELSENLRPSYIASVENQLDAGESVVDLRSEETVGVRDQPDHARVSSHR